MKIFITILFLICVSFFSFRAAIKNKPSSKIEIENETSNKKTLTYVNYGFSVDIEKDYIPEYIEPDTSLIDLFSKDFMKTESDSTLIMYQFDRADVYADLTKEKYIEARKKELNNPTEMDEPGATFEYVYGNITINPQKVTLYEDKIKITTPDGVVIQLLTSFFHKGKFVQIVLSLEEKEFEMGKKSFEDLSNSIKVF